MVTRHFLLLLGLCFSTHAQEQSPFVDLLGPTLLLKLERNDTAATLVGVNTSDALQPFDVIGLYFSADWYVFLCLGIKQLTQHTFHRCGPCRQFTPELVSFYQKMQQRRKRFEIVWISRCRDVQSYGQYFLQMGDWLALPPADAQGTTGQALNDKYKIQGIPSLVLLDEHAHVITKDARNKIPQDKTGIGFPWRHPLVTVIRMVPGPLRRLIQSSIIGLWNQIRQRVQQVLSRKPRGTTGVA